MRHNLINYSLLGAKGGSLDPKDPLLNPPLSRVTFWSVGPIWPDQKLTRTKTHDRSGGAALSELEAQSGNKIRALGLRAARREAPPMPTPNPGSNCTRGAVQTLFIDKTSTRNKIEQPPLRGRGAFGAILHASRAILTRLKKLALDHASNYRIRSLEW